MKQMLRVLVILAGVAAQAAPALLAQTQITAEGALREAMDVEQIRGDLETALKLYQSVIDLFGRTDRNVTARALFRMASIYDLKRDQRAVALFRQVASDFPGRPEAIQAREKLESLRISQDGPFLSRLVSTDRNIDELGGVKVSSSGRYAMGLGLRDSNWYLRDLETGKGRVLFACPSGCELDSQFSPDGRLAAALIRDTEPGLLKRVQAGETTVEADRARPRPTRLVIARVTTDVESPIIVELPAAPQHVVAPAAALRWSPNGRRIGFVVWVSSNAVFEPRVFAIENRQMTELPAAVAGPTRIAWSNSSEELAAYSPVSDADTVDVSLMNVITGAKRVVSIPTERGMQTTFGPWTTTGSIIVRQSTPNTGAGRILAMSRDLNKLEPVCAGQVRGGDPCIGVPRDGRLLLIWNEPALRNRVRNVETGQEHSLTTAPGEEQPGELSPDGRIVMFQSNRDGRWGLYAAAIGDRTASNPIRLAWLNGGPEPFTRMTWTDDGFMAQWTYRPSNLYRVDVDRVTRRAVTVAERLTQDGITNSRARVSPDSKQVAYWGRFGSKTGVAVMSADGSNERLVWSAAEDLSGLSPVWQSDRQVITTAAASGAMFRRNLAMINIDSGGPTLIPLPDMGNMAVHQIEYSPTKQELFYFEQSDRRVLRAKAISDGSNRVVARFDGDKILISVLITPDGRGAAYSTGYEVNPNAVGCAPSCETGYVDLETGVRTVFSTLRGRQRLAAWSPDGRYLLCGNAQPLVFDRATGESFALADPRAIPDWDGRASWAPDGSFIVFGRSSEEYEWRQWTGASIDEMLARMNGGR